MVEHGQCVMLCFLLSQQSSLPVTHQGCTLTRLSLFLSFARFLLSTRTRIYVSVCTSTSRLSFIEHTHTHTHLGRRWVCLFCPWRRTQLLDKQEDEKKKKERKEKSDKKRWGKLAPSRTAFFFLMLWMEGDIFFVPLGWHGLCKEEKEKWKKALVGMGWTWHDMMMIWYEQEGSMRGWDKYRVPFIPFLSLTLSLFSSFWLFLGFVPEQWTNRFFSLFFYFDCINWTFFLTFFEPITSHLPAHPLTHSHYTHTYTYTHKHKHTSSHYCSSASKYHLTHK